MRPAANTGRAAVTLVFGLFAGRGLPHAARRQPGGCGFQVYGLVNDERRSVAPTNSMTRERLDSARYLAALTHLGRQVLKLFPGRSFSHFARGLMAPGH